jgi:benzodiazapine receptor
MIALVVIFLLTAGAASFGALFPPGPWYAALTKPALTPPDWVFPLTWTVLYAMIGVAGWLLWRTRDRIATGHVAVAAWCLQLALNAAWSWLFFGLHLTGVALAELTVLWAAILATVLLSRRQAPLAGWLLVPYLIWVAFAGWLNLGIWRLNG